MLGLRKLAILAPLAALALAATPASAASAGGGLVEGTVSIPGGIPVITAVCGTTSYTFASTALVGAFVTSGGGAYAGLINVNANGGSSCENTQGGSGSVNVTSCTAGAVALPPGATISCSLSGAFLRVGPIVIIVSPISASLNGSCTINGSGANCSVSVAAVFVPTAGNGVTTPITSAQFAGAYVEASAS